MSRLKLSETPQTAKSSENIEKRSVWEIPRASTKASRGLQTLYFTTFFAPPALPNMCQMSANLVKCSSKQDPGVKTIVFCSVWRLPKRALWTMPGGARDPWFQGPTTLSVPWPSCTIAQTLGFTRFRALWGIPRTKGPQEKSVISREISTFALRAHRSDTTFFDVLTIWSLLGRFLSTTKMCKKHCKTQCLSVPERSQNVSFWAPRSFSDTTFYHVF